MITKGYYKNTMDKDYRSLLKNKLNERLAINPRYSLRAFARDLGMPASSLSAVMSGKQGLSLEKAKRIAPHLVMNEAEIELFYQMVLASDSRSKNVRHSANEALQKAISDKNKMSMLDMKIFKVIADWYHFAILELLTTKKFKDNEAWIAKRLGISMWEATKAIDRLKDIGLIKEKYNKLVATNKKLTTSKDVPSDSIKKFNHSILQKATQSLYEQNIEERDLSTLTIAINKEDIPEFKEMIKKFRRDFNHKAMDKKGPYDEVYCLSIQLFRLSEKDRS
ncbi:MAG: TIGR02147 family protein [Bdellovibrionales bacterium]|nr:TIGR02147 family protein [Bdellovibrionales bacterium]